MAGQWRQWWARAGWHGFGSLMITVKGKCDLLNQYYL
jgi:hypothetical protein